MNTVSSAPMRDFNAADTVTRPATKPSPVTADAADEATGEDSARASAMPVSIGRRMAGSCVAPSARCQSAIACPYCARSKAALPPSTSALRLPGSSASAPAIRRDGSPRRLPRCTTPRASA
jgi:hypothetical protein